MPSAASRPEGGPSPSPPAAGRARAGAGGSPGDPASEHVFDHTADPLEATAWFADLVEAEPFAMSVVASVTGGLVADPGRYPEHHWWRAVDAGRVVAAFMLTRPHPLHVALAPPAQSRDFARHLAGGGWSLPAVAGLRAPTEAFAEAWAEHTGVRAEVEMEVGRFDLPERPRLPFAVPGRFRVATPDDASLVDAWHQDFVDTVERTTVHTGGRRAPSLTAYLEAGLVGLWEDGSRPVSMAYASPTSGGVSRVSGVWTPPGLRRRGYASGVVHAVSDARMDAGARCMLYTDLANPTSNAIYRALGYRRTGDNVSIRFT